MEVIVTGANGQLGQDLIQVMSGKGMHIHGFGRKELDVSDLDAAQRMVRRIQPDVIIHAAAYTNVDQAEAECDEAYRVNAIGSRNMAIAAEEAGAKLCYISTDYVFDGHASAPYQEEAQTNPLSVYGKSKLAGEEMVKAHCSRSFVVRTSWVYGQHGHNFVKTMLRLAEERKEVKVVDDQIGSPTYTVHLARFIAELVRTEKYGIYHASNNGACSWYEFAKAIFAEAGLEEIRVTPIQTKDFPRPAPRPKYSVLDHTSIRANGFTDLPHWREGLREYFAEESSFH